MDKLNLDHHISRQFNEELEEIRNHVTAMGGLVEQQTADAVKAVVDADSSLGRRVADDDHKVNEMEVMVDEECNRILARRQPAASDLRLIFAIIKTITDLERIGDEAEKIGYLATRLAEAERPSGGYTELEHLGNRVRNQLRTALDSFVRMDPTAAVEVVREDSKADREYEAILRQGITFMMEDPRTIRRMLDVIWCARALERIGDHTKNICEYVVYFVHGKDVRHVAIDEVEREIREG
jgi:phosphate transport system protein